MTMPDEAYTDRRELCWQRLWAKTDSTCELRYHPLLCHLLDVAAVATLLWDHHLTPWLRKRVNRALGVDDARADIVFLSGAHDIGKASPGFQKREPTLSRGCGLPFSENDRDRPHGFITAHALSNLFGPACAPLARIAAAHHGVFPQSLNLQIGADTLGNKDWGKARADVLNELAGIARCDVGHPPSGGADLADPLLVPLLAGFISVADWIGSNQRFFPCLAQHDEPVTRRATDYWGEAREKAEEALHGLGWLPSVVYAEETSFDGVFPGLTANSLQETTARLASGQHAPFLMIIEAPMGQGKTEAGLYAADLAMTRGFARGMYVAMPTQATSNAMFGRVLDDYLRRRGHRGRLNLQLVHGSALLAQTADVQEGEIPGFEPTQIADEGGDVEAQAWFTAKKRPLLAPFGVGTIDQALLSVLQTKHWFVRLFGLAGKVVVFDEVHAYDAYMSTILERLLRWLAELDCTVLLLSATLPAAKREAFVEAYSGSRDVESERYPCITLAKPFHTGGQPNGPPVCTPLPMSEWRGVSLEFAGNDLEYLTQILIRRLEHGGCAAVVCNTVDRSIEVYKHLKRELEDTECSLFHARTLRAWRREREEEVLRWFGKGDRQTRDADGCLVSPDRPRRAVLVATQVIEQSLDLDFDLMVSEIAPVDLLLQRSGRMHRHPRHRPAGLELPQLAVLCDAARDGPPPPSFGKATEYIYDRYVLLRTWFALRSQKIVEIPAGVERLVETVYGCSPLACDKDWTAALSNAKETMDYERSEAEKAASRLLVSQPKHPSDLIEDFNQQLVDEEDPRVHEAVRAATRQGPPSITAVMLPHREPLPTDPGNAETRRLLDHSVALSHAGVFKALVDESEPPREWKQNAHLRHARLLRLDDKNRTRIGHYALSLDNSLGVTIDKDDESNG